MRKKYNDASRVICVDHHASLYIYVNESRHTYETIH